MELYRDGATLHVAGQVDGRCTHELRAAVQSQLGDEPGEIVLDFAAVDGVDLTALRMIAAVSRQAWLHGQEVRVRDCPPLVRRLLHLSHLRALVHFDDGAPVAK
ncbi:MAG: STAS domain-containing protein [Marmoricola sp.]